MNKTQKNIFTEAADRVRMQTALTDHGYDLTGTESTAMLEEMVILTFAPPVPQFEGVVARAQEAME